MRTKKMLVLMTVLLALALVLPTAALAKKKMGKPSMLKGCKACHEAAPNTLRGKLVGHSEKFKTVSINVGPLVWVVKYDDKTKVTGKMPLSKIKKGKETKVIWKGTEKNPVASLIKPKPPLTVADEKQVSFKELQDLIRAKDKKGTYALIDSRPPGAYKAGHIPYAKNLPYGKLKKMKAKVLPDNKDKLLIFYCGGFA